MRVSKDWIVDDEISERYPIYTRGNVGEVFPDPVAPLSWDLAGFRGAELGWRDAFQRFGAFDHDEFRDDDNEVLACLGGYCYLNVSVTRIFGVRVPGLTPELVDFSLFGAQAEAPPYDAMPGDESPVHSERCAKTLEWIMTVEDLPELREQQAEIEKLRANRPDLSTLTDRELFERIRDLITTYWRPLFGQHLFNSYCALVGAGVVATVAEQAGDPTMAMKLVGGIGDVDSAGPALGMWDLGRMAATSETLIAAFDSGVPGLLDRLRADGGEDARRFLDAFEQFLYVYGSRGPNEWEMRCPTWETHPEIALTAIDRMRVSPADADPRLGNERRATEREGLSAAIEASLADQPEALDQVHAGLRAAGLFLAARERSKTTIVRMINEARVAAHELGRRQVAAGHFDDVKNFGVLLEDELDRFLDDPVPFRELIREREARMAELATLEPPFVLVGEAVPSTSWSRRDARQVEVATSGMVLEGISGCSGQATGRARVVFDPSEGGTLEPGDVLVAPITDPSWTPLFVAASAVVVDVGAQVSHAVIVSRELGIPCVVSVTDGTRKIPDGAEVHVDGTTGHVTIL